MRLSLLPSYLKSYYDQLSEVIPFAEKSWYYSTSQFFSKVGAYEAQLKFNEGGRATSKLIVVQICKYILRTNAYFFLFASAKFSHFISCQKSPKSPNPKLYIDSYLIVNYALKGNGLVDNYFPGLMEILEKNNKEYAIIPRLYGSWNPFVLYRLFQLLKKKGYSVVTEFELLSFVDFVKLGFYLILYPFKMLSFYNSKIKARASNDYLKYYFWLVMNGSNFFGGVRYLFARKLLRQLKDEDKIIQWYENQPYEKTLNRVIRESEKTIEIYGCQLFSYPVELFNAYIDPNEFKSHLPQQVLVNGSYYRDENDPIRRVGPSIRYRKLFQTPIYRNLKKPSLVLFSYFDTSNKVIIQVMNSLADYKLVNLKLHPSNSIDDYKSDLKFDYQLCNGDIYKLFDNTEIVIGAASGTLVEAIACGVPALVVAKDGIVDYSYLPDFCKGILWDIVWDEESMNRCQRKLKQHLLRDSPKRREMIRRVREEMFSEPTEEKILEAFELG